LEKSSFFSRFTTKFVEVVGAGVATAVTGYLIAHFGSFQSPSSSTPVPAAITPSTVQTPATVQTAPTATVVTKAPRTVPATANVAKAYDKPNDRPVASADENAAPAAQPLRANVSAPQAAASRKRGATESGTTESKPRDRAAEPSSTEAKAEAKPHEAERDTEAVEAQVRAALANIDANRPAPSEPSRQSNFLPKAPPVAVQPQPAAEVPTATVAAVPRAADLPPPVVLQPPGQSEPPAPVEIKSRPIADVSSLPTPAPEAQQTAQEDKGLFSVFKKIPDMLRPSAATPPADPPRPPLPVGDSQ
jgi:hypothetical protein